MEPVGISTSKALQLQGTREDLPWAKGRGPSVYTAIKTLEESQSAQTPMPMPVLRFLMWAPSRPHKSRSTLWPLTPRDSESPEKYRYEEGGHGRLTLHINFISICGIISSEFLLFRGIQQRHYHSFDSNIRTTPQAIDTRRHEAHRHDPAS